MQKAKFAAAREASGKCLGRGAKRVPTRIVNHDLTNGFFAVQPRPVNWPKDRAHPLRKAWIGTVNRGGSGRCPAFRSGRLASLQRDHRCQNDHACDSAIREPPRAHAVPAKTPPPTRGRTFHCAVEARPPPGQEAKRAQRALQAIPTLARPHEMMSVAVRRP